MATKEEVDSLIATLNQMRTQHLSKIEQLKQRLEEQRPPNLFELTTDQVLAKFHKVKTFYGQGDYSVQDKLRYNG